MNTRIKQTEIMRITGTDSSLLPDRLAVEEPLEIRISHGPPEDRQQTTIAVTMRTPGEDERLAVGFLWSEGLLTDVRQVIHVGPRGFTDGVAPQSIVQVDLHPDTPVDLKRLGRNFYTTSSCGVCGKTSLEAVQTQSRFDLTTDNSLWSPDVVHRAPESLREAQAVFEETGGLHAAALFDLAGNLWILQEDVGRHNAVDKVVGAAVLSNRIPLTGSLLLVSGRASFELVQKAVMAGIPVLAAVGAPSSLAVELAKETGLTLIGFVRKGRFNCYSGWERINLTSTP